MITLVFEYRGTTHNEFSLVVPRIGESILIGGHQYAINCHGRCA